MVTVLVLEANCISNLNPNHTLQLTTLGTSVRESLQLHFNFCGVQWLLYLQDHALVIGCSLIQAGVTLSQMFRGY